MCIRFDVFGVSMQLILEGICLCFILSPTVSFAAAAAAAAADNHSDEISRCLAFFRVIRGLRVLLRIKQLKGTVRYIKYKYIIIIYLI